jgi:hypothetical protein
MADTDKSITLAPSWKNYFLWYLLGIILVPLIIGIVVLWYVHRRKSDLKYKISDSSISKIKGAEKVKIELVHILNTSVERSFFQKILGIGDIKLSANVSEIILEGIKQPNDLLDKIETAIAYQKEILKASKKIKPRKATHNPGTLEKLDYLTGLWQQGLISDEDYDKERKNFS